MNYHKPIEAHKIAPLQALFWHNFKAAGSSIHSVFEQYTNLHVADSLDYLCCQARPAYIYGKWFQLADFDFVFTVIRHPVDRLACMLRVWQQGRHEGMTAEHLLHVAGSSGQPYSSYQFSDYELWRHCQPIPKVVLNACHFVSRYESIEQDWSRVCQHIGIREQLPKLNESRRHEPAGSEFTEEQRRWILDRYKYETELGGYE